MAQLGVERAGIRDNEVVDRTRIRPEGERLQRQDHPLAQIEIRCYEDLQRDGLMKCLTSRGLTCPCGAICREIMGGVLLQICQLFTIDSGLFAYRRQQLIEIFPRNERERIRDLEDLFGILASTDRNRSSRLSPR